MPLLTYMLRLALDTGRLWVRNAPILLAILGAGWCLYTAGMLASATLGTRFDPLPTILFGLAVCSEVVSIILAIWVLKSSMRAPDQYTQARVTNHTTVPATIFQAERPVNVAVAVIGPVMAVYAVWELLDGMVRDGMLWNIMLQGTGNPTWSVSFAPDRWPMYLTIGIAAWLLRFLWGVATRKQSGWWRAPTVAFEGLWTAMSFFIMLGLVRESVAWLADKEITFFIEEWWSKFLQSLPEVDVPFWHGTLPEFVVIATRWTFDTLVPGIWLGLVLPLMWLTITAMVFGWREFRIDTLLHPEKLQETRRRLATSLSIHYLSRLRFLYQELLMKYLPLVHCFKLVWKAGVYLVGAFLVLDAMWDWATYAVHAAVLDVTARLDQTTAFVTGDFVSGVIMQSMVVCLYATTFDRAARLVLGQIQDDYQKPGPRQPVPAPPPGAMVQAPTGPYRPPRH